ncbi:hypothetical protein B0H16DRAFT_678202 [Mycena metata]|uniref:Uncharacterized protein n=1 Tax=Mycena metata TaxID=1033252 RepID=A0AAD7J646_9AGAR|nr:hypothetical protein B0H16DRAFT_678202 [Mycena metata]
MLNKRERYAQYMLSLISFHSSLSSKNTHTRTPSRLHSAALSIRAYTYPPNSPLGYGAVLLSRQNYSQWLQGEHRCRGQLSAGHEHALSQGVDTGTNSGGCGARHTPTRTPGNRQIGMGSCGPRKLTKNSVWSLVWRREFPLSWPARCQRGLLHTQPQHPIHDERTDHSTVLRVSTRRLDNGPGLLDTVRTATLNDPWACRLPRHLLPCLLIAHPRRHTHMPSVLTVVRQVLCR